MTAELTDFFAGSSSSGDRNSASAAFKAIGTVVTGTITEEPVLVQQTEFGNGTPKVDKNGRPIMQMIVSVQTDLRSWDGAIKPPTDENGIPKPPSDDTGLRTLWVKFKLRDAIADALRKAGAKGLAVGGKLAVAYTADSTFNGFSVKEYQAKYEAPVATAGTDFFGGGQASAPVAPPAKSFETDPPF